MYSIIAAVSFGWVFQCRMGQPVASCLALESKMLLVAVPTDLLVALTSCFRLGILGRLWCLHCGHATWPSSQGSLDSVLADSAAVFRTHADLQVCNCVSSCKSSEKHLLMCLLKHRFRTVITYNFAGVGA